MTDKIQVPGPAGACHFHIYDPGAEITVAVQAVYGRDLGKLDSPMASMNGQLEV